MNKKTKKIITAVGLTVIICLTFGIGFLVGRNSYSDDINTVNYILSMYKKYYYEETDDLIGAIEDALLDKYSEYYTKEEYDLVKKTAKGVREGIGITYNKETNKIISILGNSPAKKAGVKENSVILAIGENKDNLTDINSENTFENLLSDIPSNKDFCLKLSLEDEVYYCTLSKKEYTQVFVSYFDESGEYGFTDESGKMAFEKLSETSAYDFQDKEKTAYIKYTGFSGTGSGLEGSARQMEVALDKFKSSGKTCLILDLRNNGGGYMSILEKISSHFINVGSGEKKLISYAKFKDDSKETYYSDRADFQDYGFEKIVVLANSGTASASEALIGAMLDYDRSGVVEVILEATQDETGATVYKTYGKGIMQTTYQRLSGEAIKLTTAKIYWPVSNISIHGVGVTPSLNEKIIHPETISGAFYDALKLCK